MIEAREIDHLVLRARDVGALERFYCGVLGARVERRLERIGLVQLRVGRSLIDLVPAPDVSGRNLDHFCLRLETFDAAAIGAQLAAHGVAAGAVETRYGAEGDGPSIYLHDPEGNQVELKGLPDSLTQGAGGEIARRHQLHGVQPVLPVPNVEAAAGWFRDVLGFDIEFLIGTPPDYGRVRAGDGSWGQPIFIHLRQGAPAPCEVRLHVGRDVDGLYRHAVAAGGKALGEPEDQPWGLREFDLEAPGGHLLILGAEAG
jgi:glyoxylase I family protein